MKQVRKRLTYANVMSSLAVFLVIGGGVAFAAVNLPPNSVGTPQIKRNAVKTGKVAFEAIKAGKLSKNAVPTNRVRDNAIATAKIADLAVTADKLGNESVTSAKLADESVSTTKLADDAVDSAKIQNGQVRAADLGAIAETQVNGSVANNDSENLDAACPPGTRIVSGGGGINLLGPPAGVAVTASLRQGNGWRIIVRNDSGAARNIFVEAQCLEG